VIYVAEPVFPLCPGFNWDRVNFLHSNCCFLDLVWEECW